MNNPIRSLIQIFEIKKMRKMSNLEKDKTVLEIGCGQGVGTKLINKYFRPKHICAIDLDKKMINRAKKKIHLSNVEFSVGDANLLKFKDNTFDAIFDFGIIHHIPNWRKCLKELKRLLKPNGQLIIEDLSRDTFYDTFLGKILKKLLVHPYEKMFSKKELFDELKNLGFIIMEKYENSYWFSLVLKNNG